MNGWVVGLCGAGLVGAGVGAGYLLWGRGTVALSKAEKAAFAALIKEKKTSSVKEEALKKALAGFEPESAQILQCMLGVRMLEAEKEMMLTRKDAAVKAFRDLLFGHIKERREVWEKSLLDSGVSGIEDPKLSTYKESCNGFFAVLEEAANFITSDVATVLAKILLKGSLSMEVITPFISGKGVFEKLQNAARQAVRAREELVMSCDIDVASKIPSSDNLMMPSDFQPLAGKVIAIFGNDPYYASRRIEEIDAAIALLEGEALKACGS